MNTEERTPGERVPGSSQVPAHPMSLKQPIGRPGRPVRIPLTTSGELIDLLRDDDLDLPNTRWSLHAARRIAAGLEELADSVSILAGGLAAKGPIANHRDVQPS